MVVFLPFGGVDVWERFLRYDVPSTQGLLPVLQLKQNLSFH